jgi:hypothetical protein
MTEKIINPQKDYMKIKMMTLSGLILLSFCSIANSMESVESIWEGTGIKPMKISSAGIIKGATSYNVARGYLDYDGIVRHKPYAVFGNDKEKVLGVVEFDKWDINSEETLDKLIDPTVDPIKISTVEMGRWHPKFGSVIEYRDAADKDITCRSYHGPEDIKNAKNYYGLIKPHALLKDVKKVVVNSNFFFIGYHKSTITYNDDGHIKQTTTLKHKIVVATQISMATIAAGLIVKKLADKFR